VSQPLSTVSWNAARAPGAMDPWGPPHRKTFQPAVLRLVAAVLSGLAGALLVGGTFPALLTVEYDTGTYELFAWGPEDAGESNGYALRLGIPLALAAAGLLIATVLTASSVWGPRARRAGLVVTLGAVSFAVAQVWVVASYVIDSVREAAGNDLAQASQGAGYWLLMAGALFSVLSAVCLLLAQLPARRQGSSSMAPPQPAMGSFAAPLYAGPVGPYAGPNTLDGGPPAPHTWAAGAPWQSGSSRGGPQ